MSVCVTRRAALGVLASSAVASSCGLAGCGVARKVVSLAERAHGCVDVPVPNADGTLIVRSRLTSKHVRGPVTYAFVVPPGDEIPDAVAYVLPGRGSDAYGALDLGFDGFLADYVRHGGRRFALAFVDAGESYFHPRVSGEDRLAMVTEELPQTLRRNFGGVTSREAIMGQSMGGYGALLAAEREPRRFRAVGVAGPAIFPSYEDEHRSVGDAFDSAADYARYDVLAGARALRGRPVMIAIGRRDPFLPGARAFARACRSARLAVEDGCHDDGFWRASAAPLLAFVGAHL
ncbi:MAG TPA: alpha/beta hydrolase-fold protein [Candidatus Elarobacter sp.]|jgi:pimeloyl-ACP methyl ester carboxylesterase|nr:alpha/beta hydrolase-fold protein [Candidatus Elarobacter sp.]